MTEHPTTSAQPQQTMTIERRSASCWEVTLPDGTAGSVEVWQHCIAVYAPTNHPMGPQLGIDRFCAFTVNFDGARVPGPGHMTTVPGQGVQLIDLVGDTGRAIGERLYAAWSAHPKSERWTRQARRSQLQSLLERHNLVVQRAAEAVTQAQEALTLARQERETVRAELDGLANVSDE